MVLDGIVGQSKVMQELARLVCKVAPHQCPVLIHGESGTGKELIARAIQANSKRATRPFVTVNCGAIPEGLTEAILFGHEKGAFTGASFDKRGLFESAHTGTIFLDEIGEMPPNIQVKLLRTLQEHEITRVGATKSIKIDTRVIAATHRDLKKMVSAGQFREDLYYRIATVEMRIPSLKERREDIALLVHNFLNKYSCECRLERPITIDYDALCLLAQYDWPGNVRQVENLIHRLVVITNNESISGADVKAVLATELELTRDPEKEMVLERPNPTLLLPAAVAEFLPNETITCFMRRIKLCAFTTAINAYPTRTAAAKRLGLTKESLRRQLRYLRRALARSNKTSRKDQEEK